jgi:signal transduction histidine kinase
LQPFYRVETSRNRDTGGTGLGLAIAAQLTAQLNGTLQLNNRTEGGLDVVITYPAVNCTALYQTGSGIQSLTKRVVLHIV